MTDSSRKPGWRSYAAVLCLLAEALIEGVKLPFRLAAFLLRRKSVQRDMQEMLSRRHSA